MKITVKCVRVDDRQFSNRPHGKIVTWEWSLYIDRAQRYVTGILHLPGDFSDRFVMKEAKKQAKRKIQEIQSEAAYTNLVGTVLEGEL